MDLSHKPRWFARSVNPSGLVPAVVHEGVTLLESLDICQRLDELMPQQPLTPAGGASARHMQTLLSQSSSIVSAGRSKP
jgi:glutathione S-transferase